MARIVVESPSARNLASAQQLTCLAQLSMRIAFFRMITTGQGDLARHPLLPLCQHRLRANLEPDLIWTTCRSWPWRRRRRHRGAYYDGRACCGDMFQSTCCSFPPLVAMEPRILPGRRSRREGEGVVRHSAHRTVGHCARAIPRLPADAEVASIRRPPLTAPCGSTWTTGAGRACRATAFRQSAGGKTARSPSSSRARRTP